MPVSTAAHPEPRRSGRLIECALTPVHRTILMTLYATGMRRAELANLKLGDIDSRRMVIHIRDGKGRQDRDVMLSPNLLDALREHYRSLRKKPATWLFPGGTYHTADRPIDPKVVWYACREAAQRAGLSQRLHPHTLRHYLPFLTMSSNGAATPWFLRMREVVST